MTRPFSALIVALVLLTGCRTYGGYGSEAATYQQIERVLDRFEEDLSRARADLHALQAAAEGDGVIGAFAAQYESMVEGHEAVLSAQRDMAARLSPDSDYRELSRTYGAILSGQRIVRQQYEGLLRYVYDAYDADTTAVEERSYPYYVIPPYYERVSSGSAQLTMNEVLERVTSGGAPRPDFTLRYPQSPGDVQAVHNGNDHDAATGH